MASHPRASTNTDMKEKEARVGRGGVRDVKSLGWRRKEARRRREGGWGSKETVTGIFAVKFLDF